MDAMPPEIAKNEEYQSRPPPYVSLLPDAAVYIALGVLSRYGYPPDTVHTDIDAWDAEAQRFVATTGLSVVFVACVPITTPKWNWVFLTVQTAFDAAQCVEYVAANAPKAEYVVSSFVSYNPQPGVLLGMYEESRHGPVATCRVTSWNNASGGHWQIGVHGWTAVPVLMPRRELWWGAGLGGYHENDARYGHRVYLPSFRCAMFPKKVVDACLRHRRVRGDTDLIKCPATTFVASRGVVRCPLNATKKKKKMFALMSLEEDSSSPVVTRDVVFAELPNSRGEEAQRDVGGTGGGGLPNVTVVWVLPCTCDSRLTVHFGVIAAMESFVHTAAHTDTLCECDLDRLTSLVPVSVLVAMQRRWWRTWYRTREDKKTHRIWIDTTQQELRAQASSFVVGYWTAPPVIRPVGVHEIWVPTSELRRAYVEMGVDPAIVHIVPVGIDEYFYDPAPFPPAYPLFRILNGSDDIITPSVLAMGHCFVETRRGVGFSHAALAAMSMALPVVGWQDGIGTELGLPHTVVLIESHGGDITSALQWVRAHPSEARAIGLAARQHVLANWTNAVVAARVRERIQAVRFSVPQTQDVPPQQEYATEHAITSYPLSDLTPPATLPGSILLSTRPYIAAHPNFVNASALRHIFDTARGVPFDAQGVGHTWNGVGVTHVILDVVRRLKEMYGLDAQREGRWFFKVYTPSDQRSVMPHLHYNVDLTALLYLNTIELGETWYPFADNGRRSTPDEFCSGGVRTRAVAGTLVVSSTTGMDPEGMHAPCAITSGEKRVVVFELRAPKEREYWSFLFDRPDDPYAGC